MPTFFSVSLLTIVVVAGIAAVGWMRARYVQTKDASNKKTDKEVMTDNNIEIIVPSSDKQSLAGNSIPSNQITSDSINAIASLGSSLSNKLSLELVNRRQYVKAVCDRFESWSSGSLQAAFSGEQDGGVAVKPVTGDNQEASSTGNATTAFRTKPKPNNLSSFVRQCVSNIERSAFASNALPIHPISPRYSAKSNQCESPPKSSVVDERRVPNFVTATDCDANKLWVHEHDGVESPTQDEVVAKRVVRRAPSDHPTPIAFARSHAAPTLAPFAAIAMKTLPSNMLPPMWTRVEKPETVDPPMRKGEVLAPEQPTPTDAKEEPVVSSLDDEEEEGAFEPMHAPPRNASNAASRLLQFQKLVPSNQARSTFAQ